MRRCLGSLMVLAGLVLMAWPVGTWAYGLYWQEKLLYSFSHSPVQKTLLPVSATVSETVAETPSVGVRSSRYQQATLLPPRAIGQEGKKTQRRLSNGKAEKARVAVAVPKVRQRVRSGEAFARLRIPRIALDAIVVEGASGRALRRGPGHLPKTGSPGELRNCAIAAHRDAWFQRLPEVKVSDTIWVETPDGMYQYVVEEKRVVTPNRGDLLNRGAKPILTLITCTGPGYPRSRYRLLVFCRLRGMYARLPEGAALVPIKAG